jgi:hypothetical protein
MVLAMGVVPGVLVPGEKGTWMVVMVLDGCPRVMYHLSVVPG